MPEMFNLKEIVAFPLEERRSLMTLEQVVEPGIVPPPLPSNLMAQIRECAQNVFRARYTPTVEGQKNVIVMYGAHLIRNGGGAILSQLIREEFVGHIATNGAGAIHDWELAYWGKTTEDVRENLAAGRFGTWDETGLAFASVARIAMNRKGSFGMVGFGRTLGELIRHNMLGDFAVGLHQNYLVSPICTAFTHGIPATIHPGIGYDIFTCHPNFSGEALGFVAEQDFRILASSIQNLCDGGVVISIGSAVMAPQVFEKALACVNNVRTQHMQGPIKDFHVYVVDIQPGGWDWSKGEPPKTNPAYYNRMCKSFSRTGGQMTYIQCDNVQFLHNLFRVLQGLRDK